MIPSRSRRVGRQRHEQVEVCSPLKLGWQHADHGVWHCVQRNGPAQRGGVAGEDSPPETVGENDDRSEERRVGKEGRSRRSPEDEKKTRHKGERDWT